MKFFLTCRDKHRSFLQFDAIISVVCSQTYPKYPKGEVCISLQYLQKNVDDEVVLPADKHESLPQIGGIILSVGRHAQNTQNNKFAISLQHLKENMKDEVAFLPADKRQKFLEIDTVILVVCSQSCPKYPK